VSPVGEAESVALGTPAQERRHILYIHPGPVPPPTEPGHSPFWFLSRTMTGDLLSTSWRTPEAHAETLEATRAALGDFGYHATLSYRIRPPLRTLWDLGYFVLVGVGRAWRSRRYDAVVSYGTTKTGYAAWLVARLTGSRFILQLPNHPFRSFLYGEGRGAAFRASLSKWLTWFLVHRADHVNLLYPSQLEDLPGVPAALPVSVFPDFVRASQVPQAGVPSGPEVVFLGYPWHLKGVDVLLRAWRLVAAEFPDHRLRIIGHCPDRSPFERLAAGCPGISFEHPTDRALEVIAGCRVLVLPSRTEAMGRVVLEAMLAGKPVIGSDVDGIPTYVRDGETGLLFPSEDHQALADRLRWLLGDAALRGRLGTRAAEIARRDYTEAAWVSNFTDMVRRTVDRRGGEAGAR